ncbi:MAG TPA: hypothetical protein VF221_09870 [Chloroflexota bacterium]
MNRRKHGSIVILSAVVALGGSAAAKPAFAQRAAASPKPYSCQIDPSQPKCKNTGKTGGTRVTGGATGKKSGKTGGARIGGANGRSGGTSGVRGGAGGKGKSGAGGSRTGAGGSKSGSFAGSGAGANGSSPIPGRGLPVTGYGGTAQDLGASPRASAAGTQPVVVGLASQTPAASTRIVALPATGGGSPSQPASPLLALLAAALAAVGVGLRTAVRR